MSRFLHWLAASLGYLAYTLLVVGILLWVQLPRESLRLWLEGQLNTASPALQWEVKGLHAALPGALVATDLRVREAGSSGVELLQVAELRVLPDLKGLLTTRKEMPWRYQLRILDGTVKGHAVLQEKGDGLRCDGEMLDLQLSGMPAIWNKLNRAVTGKLAGSFRFEGPWRHPVQGAITADLRAADGSINLLQPVLGLEQLEFSAASAALQLENKTLTVSNGKFESRMLAADFGGSLALADNLPLSALEVDGSLEPRSELLSGLSDQLVVEQIKKQLKDNRLSFFLSGTMLEPGVKFQGATGVIDAVFQGGGR
jgi:type II secretion system protein N